MKTVKSVELQKMISSLSGLSPKAIEIRRLNDAGDFTVGLSPNFNEFAAALPNVRAICERLRGHYRLSPIRRAKN